MLAENDEYITEASETIYQLTQEEHIRLVCEAREDYYRRQRSVAKKLQRLQENEAIITKQATTIDEQATTIDEQATTIDEQATTIDEQATTIENLNAKVTQANAALQASKDEIAQLKSLLKEHNIPLNE